MPKLYWRGTNGRRWSIDTVLPDPAAAFLTGTGVMLLRLLDSGERTLTFSELAAETGLARSDVRRGLRRLHRLGLVTFDERGTPLINRTHALYPSVRTLLAAQTRTLAHLAELAAEHLGATTTVALVANAQRIAVRTTVAVVYRDKRDLAEQGRDARAFARAVTAHLGAGVEVLTLRMDEIIEAPSRVRQRYWKSHTLIGPDLAATLLDERVHGPGTSRGHS